MHWEKSSEGLVEAFHAVMQRFPDVVVRRMFGYPAGFVGGNMVTGLHQQKWVVRLADGERERLLAMDGAAPFEPMPGRPMKGYATLPADVVADPDATAGWVERAIAFGRTLPPKSK